ncbi:hypothetical protein Tco_0276130 [Tanacetum coccineum]
MSPAPSPEPPLDHRSTVVGNGGQRWSTATDHRRPPPEHRRTTGQPPLDHRSTMVDRQLMVRSNGGHRCHVAAKWYHVATHGMKWQLTWLLTWRGGDITLLLSFELMTKGYET